MPFGDFGYIEGEQLGRPYDLGLLKRLFPYLWPWRYRWILGLVLSLGLTFLDLVPPYLTKQAIDRHILTGDMAGLSSLALLLLLILALNFGLQYIQVMVLERLGQQVMHTLRLKLFSHILSLPLSFFQHNPIGKLVTRVTNDIENLNEMVKSLLATLFKDIFLVLGILGILLTLDVRLALVTFTMIPLIFISARLFSRKARDAFRDLRRRIAQVNAFIQESLAGMVLIQILGREKKRSDDFVKVNHQTYLAGMKQIQVFALFLPLMELISVAAIALLIWYGGGQVVQKALSLGTLVAFLSYIQMFFKPLREMTEKYSVMQSAMASLERIFELMDEPAEEEIKEPAFDSIAEFEGKIEFQKVRFAYTSENWVIKDLSFTINPGEAVAIVGMTGGGKSTLIHLLEGFYRPQYGQILIDGKDIQTFPKKRLRSNIGLVPQETFLFEGDLKENILLKPAEGSRWGWKELTETMQLGSLLIKNENQRVSSLSAGEQQLVALARVMARDPGILVLDEATSQIDAYTERLVQAAISKLLVGRTSLIIAHRLFTLRQAQRILVIHEGRLVEDGSHEELMRKKGYYFRLYQLQFSKDVTDVGNNIQKA
ncbi:MAG: antibiotic ABC transporter ATP-binding protein [Desulfobacca sp.]|nr:antibiotic ABC transporter ATP-binding protein [Desulfobacca sp.]